MKIGRAGFRKAVKVGEENALEILVDLFDCLDNVEPPPTREIIPLYVKPQVMCADNHACVGQVVAKEVKHPAVSSSTCLHLLETYP